MESTRVDFNTGVATSRSFPRVSVLTYRVVPKATSSSPNSNVDKLFPTVLPTLQFTVKSSVSRYPKLALGRVAGIVMTGLQKEFTPMIASATTPTYAGFTEQLTYKVIEPIKNIRTKARGWALFRPSVLRTPQQIEAFRSYSDLQNNQSLQFIVLRKANDLPDPGTSPSDVADSVFPIQLNVSHDAYVGIGSTIPESVETIVDADGNIVPYKDGAVKVDRSLSRFRLITGKNKIKVSFQINPTYLISKSTKG